ncbi:MAG: M28 family peptidase [Planctomycetes bacterium]|nr:M28 family peptidase [Planctomycetota bacterium]
MLWPTRSPADIRATLTAVAVAATLTAALAAQSPFAKPHELPADRMAGTAAVSIEDCKKWLFTLASPEFEGRQTGQPGFQKAAEFVSAHFQKLGLEARGENGTFYQTVPWSVTKVVPENSYLEFQRAGAEPLRIPADRLAGNVVGNSSAEGEVVFLVVESPAAPADGQRFRVPKIPGLADLAVEGKVVVAYVKPARDGLPSALGRLAVTQSLQGKGAAAVLFAQQEQPAGGLRGRSSASRRAGNPAVAGAGRVPSDLAFGGTDLTTMLKLGGAEAAVLEGTAMTPTITLRAKFEVAVQTEQAPAMNVFAVLPGSDPQLRNEYVVVGSHLDHVGTRGGLHPGADDDASGTTGVMAVAQMFVKNPNRPKRSVLFVCFAGEEDGLIGSDFFAKNCPVPLASIVGELQMDMIGRDEEENREGNRGERAEDNRTSLHLVGTQKLAPALHELCLKKNDAAAFDIEYDQEGMFGRSDHANFAKYGVPIAFFFTGLHRDYHETTDTPDKIHYEKLLRVATYVYDIAFELGVQDERPLVDPVLWQNYRGKQAKEPAAPLIGGKAASAPATEGGK